ncbi:MAG: division plane positioning ATPase MipZ [Pseudomonadota bacterium]
MILLFGGLKGGVGTSTLAVNSAVELASNGDNVWLIDCDHRKSAYQWHVMRQRAAHTPPISCSVANGRDVIQETEKRSPQADHIIIDAGNTESVHLRAGLTVADKFVAPIQPTQFDLWTLDSLHSLQQRAAQYNPKLSCNVVLNRVQARIPGSQTEDAISAIEEIQTGLFCGAVIADNLAYQNSAMLGQAAKEWAPSDGKVATEILRMVGLLLGTLKTQDEGMPIHISKDQAV